MIRSPCHRNPGVFSDSDELSFADDAGVRSRESFNAGWRFARFGPMADGSTRPEPGAERWTCRPRPRARNHRRGTSRRMRSMAIRKPAGARSSGGTNEWLRLDLGQDQKIGRIALDWEVSGADLRQRDRDQLRRQAMGSLRTGPSAVRPRPGHQASRGQVGEHPRDPPLRLGRAADQEHAGCRRRHPVGGRVR